MTRLDLCAEEASHLWLLDRITLDEILLLRAELAAFRASEGRLANACDHGSRLITLWSQTPPILADGPMARSLGQLVGRFNRALAGRPR